jgi:hypothetical protein
MTWNSVMGFVSSFALFLPIALIVALRLHNYKSFPALLVYYSSVFIYNLMTEGYLPVSKMLVQNWGLVNNLLDAPLMLVFLTYFSPSVTFSKRIKIAALFFVVFEILVIAFRGLNFDSITIILGPGIIMIATLCLHFFVRHAKMAIEFGKSTGKALIAGSLLFAYGCFGLIYLMYYVFKTPHVADTFLVYFMAATVSALLMSAGLIYERILVKKIKEVQVTRRELSEIYKDTKMAAPVRTAMLDFDKESWN